MSQKVTEMEAARAEKVATAKATKAAAPAKKRSAKAADKQRVSDEQLTKLVAGFVKKLGDDATKSGVVKAIRAGGHSAAGKRIRSAFDQATKANKSKAKTAKGAAKVREKEAAYGINR